jgi:hypothetical protein
VQPEHESNETRLAKPSPNDGKAAVEMLAAANVLTIKAKERRERRILRTPFKNERTIPSFRLSDSAVCVYETGFFTKTSGVPIVRGMHDVTFLTISTR